MLECGEHFALLLSVHERMMVLHRDEGREVMRDSIICDTARQYDLSKLSHLLLTLHDVDYDQDNLINY